MDRIKTSPSGEGSWPELPDLVRVLEQTSSEESEKIRIAEEQSAALAAIWQKLCSCDDDPLCRSILEAVTPPVMSLFPGSQEISTSVGFLFVVRCGTLRYAPEELFNLLLLVLEDQSDDFEQRVFAAIIAVEKRGMGEKISAGRLDSFLSKLSPETAHRIARFLLPPTTEAITEALSKLIESGVGHDLEPGEPTPETRELAELLRDRPRKIGGFSPSAYLSHLLQRATPIGCVDLSFFLSRDLLPYLGHSLRKVLISNPNSRLVLPLPCSLGDLLRDGKLTKEHLSVEMLSGDDFGPDWDEEDLEGLFDFLQVVSTDVSESVIYCGVFSGYGDSGALVGPARVEQMYAPIAEMLDLGHQLILLNTSMGYHLDNYLKRHLKKRLAGHLKIHLEVHDPAYWVSLEQSALRQEGSNSPLPHQALHLSQLEMSFGMDIRGTPVGSIFDRGQTLETSADGLLFYFPNDSEDNIL